MNLVVQRYDFLHNLRLSEVKKSHKKSKKRAFFGCAIVFHVVEHVELFGRLEKSPYLCTTLKT